MQEIIVHFILNNIFYYNRVNLSISIRKIVVIMSRSARPSVETVLNTDRHLSNWSLCSIWQKTNTFLTYVCRIILLIYKRKWPITQMRQYMPYLLSTNFVYDDEQGRDGTIRAHANPSCSYLGAGTKYGMATYLIGIFATVRRWNFKILRAVSKFSLWECEEVSIIIVPGSKDL